MLAAPAWAGEREYQALSADGTAIHGAVATPDEGWNGTAVIMVAGTGLFDRDVAFGRSGSPRDRLFRDLADRFVARGLGAVRYDRRGVRHGATTPAEQLDTQISGSSTVETQRDDLAAVRAWAESPAGLGARCVILFGHSEGILHIARLAASGAPAPLMVMGVGAPMRSPTEIVRWQSTGRDAYSLELMDADGDGVTTNAEVEANWRQTPSSAFDNLAPLLRPAGRWTAADIAQVRTVQAQRYEQARAAALALDDAAPYPNAATPMARASWWKSWFTDETPAAASLATWDVPFELHWGALDSQTPPALEAPQALAALGAKARVTIHPRRGHSLGEHALYGPMDEALADRLADEAAAAATACGSNAL
ncbi:MAG: hypothetical protein B7Z08_12540 [Sphingomonadales bacterium 32-68-7]|nr:MAG: hypothetical protein B7Z33_12915 [Sphingomonadales bacterium 12-68-11]OYX07344.1 MAG: hypothetical protein B7Z08_12540 [Sphingomonadales bacterium 32-68-7]